MLLIDSILIHRFIYTVLYLCVCACVWGACIRTILQQKHLILLYRLTLDGTVDRLLQLLAVGLRRMTDIAQTLLSQNTQLLQYFFITLDDSLQQKHQQYKRTSQKKMGCPFLNKGLPL